MATLTLIVANIVRQVCAKHKIAALLLLVTVTATAICFAVSDLVEACVNHQEFPVICFLVEATLAFYHYNNQLRGDSIFLREFLPNDD